MFHLAPSPLWLPLVAKFHLQSDEAIATRVTMMAWAWSLSKWAHALKMETFRPGKFWSIYQNLHTQRGCLFHLSTTVSLSMSSILLRLRGHFFPPWDLPLSQFTARLIKVDVLSCLSARMRVRITRVTTVAEQWHKRSLIVVHHQPGPIALICKGR